MPGLTRYLLKDVNRIGNNTVGDTTNGGAGLNVISNIGQTKKYHIQSCKQKL